MIFINDDEPVYTGIFSILGSEFKCLNYKNNSSEFMGRYINSSILELFNNLIEDDSAYYKSLMSQLIKLSLITSKLKSKNISYKNEVYYPADLFLDFLFEISDNYDIFSKKLIDFANLFISAFCNVGLYSIIDEATGYQNIRDSNELSKIFQTKYERLNKSNL